MRSPPSNPDASGAGAICNIYKCVLHDGFSVPPRSQEGFDVDASAPPHLAGYALLPFGRSATTSFSGMLWCACSETVLGQIRCFALNKLLIFRGIFSARGEAQPINPGCVNPYFFPGHSSVVGQRPTAVLSRLLQGAAFRSWHGHRKAVLILLRMVGVSQPSEPHFISDSFELLFGGLGTFTISI